MCKNPGIETQKQKSVDKLKRALAINHEEPSQDPVLESAVTQPPLALQELCTIMRGMAREEAEHFYLVWLQASKTKAAEKSLRTFSRQASDRSKAA